MFTSKNEEPNSILAQNNHEENAIYFEAFFGVNCREKILTPVVWY